MPLPDHPSCFQIEPDLVPIDQVKLTNENREIITGLIEQHQEVDKLAEKNLKPIQTLYLHGAPGTGKTLVSKAIAHTLKRTLYTFNDEALCTDDRKQAQQTLKDAFAFINHPEQNNIFLFDEFEAIATARSAGFTDPITRLIASRFMRYIEKIIPNTIVICATNYPHLVDGAMRRRLKAACHFPAPKTEQRIQIIQNTLKNHGYDIDIDHIAYLEKNSLDISLDETKDAVLQAMRQHILRGTPIDFTREVTHLKGRKHISV